MPYSDAEAGCAIEFDHQRLKTCPKCEVLPSARHAHAGAAMEKAFVPGDRPLQSRYPPILSMVKRFE